MEKMQFFFYTLFFICFCQSATAQDTLLLLTGRQIVVSSVDMNENTIAYRTINDKSKLKKIDPGRVFSVIYKDGNERIIYQPDSLDPLEFKVEEMRNFIKGEQDAHKFYKNTTIKVVGFGLGAGFGLLTFYGLVGPPLYGTIVGSYSPDVDKKLSFSIEGNAADELGISSGKYLNNITGNKSAPIIKKDQILKLSNKTIKFKQNTDLDSTVSLINSQFNCIHVNASNEKGKIRLYKSDSPELIPVGAYREGFEKKVRDYKIVNGIICGYIGFAVGAIAYSFLFN